MKKIPKNKVSAQGTKKSSKTKLVLAPLVDFGRPQVLKEPSHPSLIAFKRNIERPPTPYEDIRTRKHLRSPDASSPSSEASVYAMESKQTKRSSKMPPLAMENNNKHESCDSDETNTRRQNTRSSFLPKIDGSSRNSFTSQPPNNNRSSIVKLPPADCRNVVAQGSFSRDGRPSSPPAGSLTSLDPPTTNGKAPRKRRTKSRRHIHSNFEHEECEITKKAKL